MDDRKDFFVAAMTCPVCSRVSPADSSTNMATYIAKHPRLANIGVGDGFDFDARRIADDGFRDANYRTLRVPAAGEAVRILDTWECPYGDAPMNWAMITIEGGVVREIVAVPLDHRHVEAGHLLSNEALSAAADVTGLPFEELVDRDWVRLLREGLSAIGGAS